MSRNGSGIYTLPEPPFVPLTTISSTAVNSDLSDIATALTGSLARDGQGGMTAVLPLNTSGFSYTNDTNTGMYRTGSDAQAIKCGGTDIVAVNTSGASVIGTFSATGAISQNGSPLIPIGLGPLPWSLDTAPPLWALCYGQACTSAYAAYRAALVAEGSPYGNNGTDPLFPDMRGVSAIGKTNMGGSTRSNLTSTYYGNDPTTLGSEGGSQSTTMLTANLPPYTPSGVLTGGSTALNAQQGGLNAGGILFASNTAAFAFGAALSTAPTFVGASQGGTSTPFSRMQPGIITNYIVFVGV